MKPTLKQYQQYQGIPGADITFPRAGIYELKLSGTPKAGFKPFALTYESYSAARKFNGQSSLISQQPQATQR